VSQNILDLFKAFERYKEKCELAQFLAQVVGLVNKIAMQQLDTTTLIQHKVIVLNTHSQCERNKKYATQI